MGSSCVAPKNIFSSAGHSEAGGPSATFSPREVIPVSANIKGSTPFRASLGHATQGKNGTNCVPAPVLAFRKPIFPSAPSSRGVFFSQTLVGAMYSNVYIYIYILCTSDNTVNAAINHNDNHSTTCTYIYIYIYRIVWCKSGFQGGSGPSRERRGCRGPRSRPSPSDFSGLSFWLIYYIMYICVH